MAERSKALRSGRSPLRRAWVRIPLLTNNHFDTLPLLTNNHFDTLPKANRNVLYCIGLGLGNSWYFCKVWCKHPRFWQKQYSDLETPKNPRFLESRIWFQCQSLLPCHFITVNSLFSRYIPSDFFLSDNSWNRTFPIHSPFKLHHPASFHVFSKDHVEQPSDATRYFHNKRSLQ